jgi:diguanylate cyclase (GGDEF)-like protein
MLDKNTFSVVHLQDFTLHFTQNVCTTIFDMTGIRLTPDSGSYCEESFAFNHGMIVYLNFYGKVQGEFIIGISMKDALAVMSRGECEDENSNSVREEVSGFFKEVINIASAQTLVEVEKKYANLTYFPPVVVFGDIFFPEVRSASVMSTLDDVVMKSGFSLNLVRPKIVEKLERIEKSLEKSEKLASTDALTKLYNRTFFESMFNVYIEENKSLNQHLSILLIDIDRFKTVNDTHGHLIGDQVIKFVALAIRNSLRNSDIAVRYGGDEILVVLSATEADEARDIAEKIRQAVKNIVTVPTTDDAEISVELSVSIGCTELTELDEPVTLFERADSFLYKAKEEGRDRVISDKDWVEMDAGAQINM